MYLASVSWKSVKLAVRLMVFSTLFLLTRSAVVGAQPWTAVGSTGVIVSGSLSYDCADQAIGFFRQSPIVVNCLGLPVIKEPVVTDPNIGLLPPLPKGSGRVVYNVVAEPELEGAGASPALTVRYLVSDNAHQHITVRLIQQPRYSTSTAVDVLLTLNSDSLPASSFTQTQTVETCSGQALDFDNNAYYITADISNANTTGGAAGVYQVVVGPANCIF
jgi:hypothetical protein